MNGIQFIGICIVLGLLANKTGRFPTGFSRSLNAYVINVALPALAFLKIREIAGHSGFAASIWLPISMPWIQFGFALLFLEILKKLTRWNNSTAGALILTVGLGNTSFVGFPMLEAFFGPEALKTGVLVDQPGSFLVLSTLGIFVGEYFSNRSEQTGRGLSKKVLSNPAFLAMILGFGFCWVKLPEALSYTLNRLGETLIPVALIAVGFQLEVRGESVKRKAIPLITGLFTKLILFPSLAYFLYFKVFPYEGQVSRIIVVESAMGPMITGAVLASEMGLDSELAHLMLGIGVPLSLITVPIWVWLLSFKSM